MKTKLFFLLIPVLLFSCTPNTSRKLSEKELSQATDEVKNSVNKLISFAEKSNVDSLLLCFSDSPDFVYLIGGTPMNYSEMEKAMRPVFDSMSNQKFTILDEKISFPDPSVVFYTASGSDVMNMKNGTSVTLDPYALFLAFKKINDQWKVIYGSESFIQKPAEVPVSH